MMNSRPQKMSDSKHSFSKPSMGKYSRGGRRVRGGRSRR
jgi:hypothetical protein